jgi:prepilin-type N-terminal cleavage/methylation domain-containing protein
VPIVPAAEHGFTPRSRSGEHGFTIVELMVSLLIFAMLAAAGVALLGFSVRAEQAAAERLDENAALQRARAILTADLAQAAPRITRDRDGARVPSFVGGTGAEGRSRWRWCGAAGAIRMAPPGPGCRRLNTGLSAIGWSGGRTRCWTARRSARRLS